MNIELLQQENDRLRKELSQKESIIKMSQKESQQKILQVHKKYYLRDLMKGFELNFGDSSQDAQVAVINALMEEGLKKRDAELYLDDNEGLRLRNIDGTNVISDSHKQLDPASFLEMVLTENNALGKVKQEETTEKQIVAPGKYSQLREEVKKSKAAFASGVEFNPLKG